MRITTSDGLQMTGDAFSMDLKLNRFVLAGHVHARSAAGSQEGAALADFISFNRIYFLPITGEPDRWTFVNGDFAHPLKGREMPGDTFFFPDLGKAKPFLVSDSAVVSAGQYLRFGSTRLVLAGAHVPLPSYYINFSTDRHLSENSLAGANYDATWNLAGSANAISALHFRYDTQNKTYLSVEQHFSSKKAYAVFSLNPMTRPSKFWDLVASDQPSNRFQVRLFSQLHTFQSGLSSPLESGQFTIVQATQALPHSFVQLNTQLTNYTMLPIPPYSYQGHGAVALHPFSMQLNGSTFNNRVGRLPLFEQLTYGLGYLYSSYGLQTVGGVAYRQIWQHTLGLNLYVPSFKLGHSLLPTKNYYLNASFSKNRLWDAPLHYIDTTTTQASLSKMFDRHFSSFLNYSVENLGDYYGALQNTIYTPVVPIVGGVSYPGYAAFSGAATFRTLALDVTYVNSGDFTASILVRKHDDFPAPIPNYFQTPPLDPLGREIAGANYLGQPPYDFTADVRARLGEHLRVDIARSYYFNFGNRGWNPEFVIQFTQ